MYKSNLSVNNYLSKCDFINKYNSLNTQNLLKVSNICLTVDFKQGKEVGRFTAKTKESDIEELTKKAL